MGRDFNSHLTNIASVLHRLRNAGLKVKPTKCDFFKQEVMFLGHVISEKGISTDKSKVDKVVHGPHPLTCNSFNSSLGLPAITGLSFKILLQLASHSTALLKRRHLSTGHQSVLIPLIN